MEEERWVPIEGFSKYDVSNLGHVRRHRKKGDRVLPQHKNRNCLSMFVNMVNDKGEWKTAPVARLVLHHFVGGDGQSIKAELAGFISAIRSKGCLIAHGEGDGVGRACP